MLLKIYKSTQPLTTVLITLSGVVLWIEAFINPLKHTIFATTADMPLFLLVNFLFQQLSITAFSVYLAFLCILFQAIQIIRLNENFHLTLVRTYLPSFLFILLAGWNPDLHRLLPIHFANILLIFAIHRIFNSYKIDNVLSNYFDAAFAISIASLFYLYYIFFIPIIFFSLLIIRPYNWREWFTGLLGAIIPYILVITYYFVFGNGIENFVLILKLNLQSSNSMLNIFENKYFLYLLLFLFVLILFSSFSMFNWYAKMNISTRKYHLILLWLFIFGLVIFTLNNLFINIIFVWLAFIISFMIANFFVMSKRKFILEVLFLALVVYIAFMQFIY